MLAYFAVPTLSGLIAVVYALVWLSLPGARIGVARRYPLRLLTWFMAFPGGLASFAALFFAVVLGLDMVRDGDSATLSLWDLVLPGLGLLGVASAVAVIVMAHRVMSRGKKSRPWLMLVFATPPVLAVVVLTANGLQSDPLACAAGLLLASGGLANALMAVPRASNPVPASPLPPFLGPPRPSAPATPSPPPK